MKMTETTRREQLILKLDRLSKEAVLVFGLGCAERLFPNYLKFFETNQWGNPSAIRSALDFGWDYLTQPGSLDLENLDSLKQECERAAPEIEMFSELTSPALDAAGGAYLILDFIAEGQTRAVADVASLCVNTVDTHIRHTFLAEQGGLESIKDMDAYLEREEYIVQNHFLWLREIKHQKSALDFLSSEDGRLDFSELKSRWSEAVPKTL